MRQCALDLDRDTYCIRNAKFLETCGEENPVRNLNRCELETISGGHGHGGANKSSGHGGNNSGGSSSGAGHAHGHGGGLWALDPAER